MKPVKITAEITLTPEMFEEWSDCDFPLTELWYKHYVEKMTASLFGTWASYDDLVNNVFEHSTLKLTLTELD